MHKLIIVDDEKIIRDGLTSFVNWKALGFEVVGTFSDGKDALEYINTKEVDVVFTDIKMSKVNGLELAEYIYKNKINIKVVLLSGIKEFKYAQKAIAFGVNEYITKPLDFSLIRDIFTNIKEDLDKKKLIQEKKELYEKNYQEILPLFIEHFFEDLLLGVITSENNMKERMDILNLEIYKKSCFSLSCIEIEKLSDYVDQTWKYGFDSFKRALDTLLSKKVGKIQSYAIIRSIDTIFLLTYSDEKEEFMQLTIDYLKGIQKSLRENFKLEMKYEVIKETESLLAFSGYYKEKTNNEKKHLKVGEGLSETDLVYKQLEELEGIILSYINSSENEAIVILLKDYIELLDVLSDEDKKNRIINFYVYVTSQVSKMGIDLTSYKKKKIDYSELLYTNDQKGLLEWCEKNFIVIMNILNPYKQDTKQYYINEARSYINTHYGEDLSLSQLADFVHLSPAYFSQIFKEEMSINFTEYLLETRMRKAITLLMDKDKKVFEISEQVGYKSSKYFAKLFKKYTGYTPTEFQLYHSQQDTIKE